MEESPHRLCIHTLQLLRRGAHILHQMYASTQFGTHSTHSLQLLAQLRNVTLVHIFKSDTHSEAIEAVAARHQEIISRDRDNIEQVWGEVPSTQHSGKRAQKRQK